VGSLQFCSTETGAAGVSSRTKRAEASGSSSQSRPRSSSNMILPLDVAIHGERGVGYDGTAPGVLAHPPSAVVNTVATAIAASRAITARSQFDSVGML
jgi:hypothetical protein